MFHIFVAFFCSSDFFHNFVTYTKFMRIFLLGYMGCGKSTMGKELAQKLKLTFFDLDEHIEREKQKTISDIFATEGEDSFRNYEREALNHFFEKENIVVATGGGAPCFFDNMEQINNQGVSIYLKLTAEELAHRLKRAKEARPIIKDKNDEELKGFIEDMLNHRNQFYTKAKIIFNNNIDIETAVDKLAKQLIGK